MNLFWLMCQKSEFCSNYPDYPIVNIWSNVLAELNIYSLLKSTSMLITIKSFCNTKPINTARKIFKARHSRQLQYVGSAFTPLIRNQLCFPFTTNQDRLWVRIRRSPASAVCGVISQYVEFGDTHLSIPHHPSLCIVYSVLCIVCFAPSLSLFIFFTSIFVRFHPSQLHPTRLPPSQPSLSSYPHPHLKLPFTPLPFLEMS